MSQLSALSILTNKGSLWMELELCNKPIFVNVLDVETFTANAEPKLLKILLIFKMIFSTKMECDKSGNCVSDIF